MLSGLKALTYSVNSNGTELAPLHTQTTSSLSFFLVHRSKRARHANNQARDWRRETGEALVLASYGFAARRSPVHAFPSLNLKKKGYCSQSQRDSGWLKIFFRICGSYLITLHVSVAQKLSNMWRSTFAPLQKSPKSLLLCLNRSSIQYGFRAGVKAIRRKRGA